jgi:hypothetical protein
MGARPAADQSRHLPAPDAGERVGRLIEYPGEFA